MSEEEVPWIAIQHGAHVNQIGDHYINGQAYIFLKKLKVAAAYQNVKGASGTRPNITKLQRQFCISKGFIKNSGGGVVVPW